MKIIQFSKAMIIFLSLGVLLSGCKLTDEETSTIEQVLSGPPAHNPPDPTPLPKEGVACHSEAFYQPEAEINRSLDILFVVDSSGSLSEEREAVGDGIDVFIEALPVGLDIRVGVMLAHAGAYSGRLYRYSTQWPLVLDSGDYAVDELRSILRTRMRRVRSERETDGGEVGLYSLNRAMDADRLEELQALGFLRDQVGLAVVFVADENDICARYPEGIDRVFDPDRKELPAFDNYCSDVTPGSVFHRLKLMQGEAPLVVSGIIYNEDSQFNYYGENEIGYGYTDIIKLSNGLAIDLAGGHIHQGLDQLGSLVTRKLTLITEFLLRTTQVDAATISVRVDGLEEAFDYSAVSHQIELTGYAGIDNSLVEVDYCEPPPVGEGDDTNGGEVGGENGGGDFPNGNPDDDPADPPSGSGPGSEVPPNETPPGS